jgi:integrase
MARKGGIDRGICQRKGRKGWWVRLFNNNRERWFKCDTKSQAKALYGRMKADAREGKYFPRKPAARNELTLRAWINRCLDSSNSRGIKNERRYGRRWSLLMGKLVLGEITTDGLRNIQAKMRVRKCKISKRRQRKDLSWSNGTINRHFAFLRHVLMLAIRDGKLDRNPVCGIKFLPEEKRTRYLTDNELSSLERLVKPDHWKLVAFAIETGLRREEQFTLRWEHVDLESEIVTIPLPKGGRTRHVPLSDGALDILRSSGSLLTSPWVFPNPKNPLKHLSAQGFVNRVFMPSLNKAGIRGVCWHTLRHTAASRRIMAGVDIVAVKEILGHRDIQTTLRYAHLSPGHLKQAINRGTLNRGSRSAQQHSSQEV